MSVRIRSAAFNSFCAAICGAGGGLHAEGRPEGRARRITSARGAGVPKGTILCLGRRVLDAHDEQDDAEGGRRDWEEDLRHQPGAAPRHACAWRSFE